MKVIYIKYKTLILTNIFIFGLLIFLTFFALTDHGVSVFKQITGEPIYKGDHSQAKVALECNVVWGTEYVPEMLRIFKDKGVHITFFIGGQWAKDNPDQLRQIVKQGHEIGNHGYNHKSHSKISNDENYKEIYDTEKTIKEITGLRTSLFAPPSGDFNKVTLDVAHSMGYKTILWSIDTIDWRREGKDIILRRVMKNPHNGAFILMHPTQFTVEALPDMIDQLRESGFEIGTVGELLSEE